VERARVTIPFSRMPAKKPGKMVMISKCIVLKITRGS
jgi:hypothetical protein